MLLGLTEMAYASFEKRAGIGKPDHVYAVQRSTEAVYYSPLAWDEGAWITVATLRVSNVEFDQEFAIESRRDGRRIATFKHRWVWLDIETGKRVQLTEEDQQRLMSS